MNKKSVLAGIAILALALSVTSVSAAAGKSWYSQLNNKGWYQWEGQSGSTSKTEDSTKSSLLNTSQMPGYQTPYGTATSTQGATQASQPTTIFQNASSGTSGQ